MLALVTMQLPEYQRSINEKNRFTTITGYSKKIVNIVKIYTKEQKYSSINKSLNYKLIIFYDICN